MKVTRDDADDQAGHGECHEENGEERSRHDKEDVVDLTTCVINTFFFCFALLVSFVLEFRSFFLPSLDIQEREVLFERSEFLIATSKKKKLTVCVDVCVCMYG